MNRALAQHYLQPSNRLDSQNALNELIMLHRRGILTDSEFNRLVRIASNAYVNTEFEERIVKALENAFIRYFNVEESYVR